MRHQQHLTEISRKKAREIGIPQHILQSNYFLERFLYRIFLSKHKDKFILKGGILLSNQIGIESRNTKDIDFSLYQIANKEETIINIISEICSVKTDDNISYKFKKIIHNQNNREYNGYSVLIDYAFNDNFVKNGPNIKIDLSFGEIITPQKIYYNFKFTLEDIIINIPSYNFETYLSEKIESILKNSEINTRMKDFYDIYMIVKIKKFKFSISDLSLALYATTKFRNTSNLLDSYQHTLEGFYTSQSLHNEWKKFQSENPYAENIEFNKIIDEIIQLCNKIIK